MKTLRKIVSLVLILGMALAEVTASPQTVYARGERKEGNWNYVILDAKTCKIIGYAGEETVVEVPDSIGGYQVSYIDHYAIGYNWSRVLDREGEAAEIENFELIEGFELTGAEGNEAAREYAARNNIPYNGVLVIGMKPVIRVERYSADSITLEWTARCNARYYELYRRIGDGEEKLIYTLTREQERENSGRGINYYGNQYTDTEVRLGAIYTYSLTAYFDRGLMERCSVEATAGIRGMPKPIVTSLDSRTNQVTWEETYGAKGYRIYRRLKEEEEYSLIGMTTSRLFVDQTCELGTVYRYKVCAYAEADGVVIEGAGSAAECETKLAKPTVILKRSTGNRLELAIRSPNQMDEGNYNYGERKVSGYIVYRKDADGKAIKVKTIKLRFPSNANLWKYWEDPAGSASEAQTYIVKAYYVVNGTKYIGNAQTVRWNGITQRML